MMTAWRERKGSVTLVQTVHPPQPLHLSSVYWSISLHTARHVISLIRQQSCARYWEKRDQLFPVFALLVNLFSTVAARRRQRSFNLKLSHGFWGSALSPPLPLTIKHDLSYFLPAFHWKSLSNFTHEKIHNWWGDSLKIISVKSTSYDDCRKKSYRSEILTQIN
jgi:hypothetical protein